MFRTAYLLLLSLACVGTAAAQTFADDFESAIPPQFPQANGIYQLPPAPVTTRLNWLLGELQAGATTTADEVNANFDPAWLANTNVQQTIDFIAAVRNGYPNARLTDLITHTPTRLTALIDSPGSPPPSGFFVFGTRYAGSGLIVQFGVSSFGGSVQFPVDQNLTLAQAADKFVTLSGAAGLLVARIGSAGQCTPVEARAPTVPRATGSVFKMWVLGGVARRIQQGGLSSTEILPVDPARFAQGGTLNVEPTGTPIPIRDHATLMMGISDNSATDHLHARAGRPAMDAVVAEFGNADPTILQPLLNVSEQFHLFRSFDLATSQSYVNGTESFQNTFLANQIVPLGPNLGGGAFFHAQLLTDGSWRASPNDVCAALSALRRQPGGSEAFKLVDAAMSASVAQPNVRNAWDRAWYKGGTLASGGNGLHVLVHAWLLEDAGRDPYVVVAMANTSTGGIDQFNVQSVLGRILQLLAAAP
ncbi:MAG: class A beta-lactamase-related serine hydrolase [Xanthomonadaceae bacterium]|jgi:beta-lactamase class A|nr:class A beta-lactamase-related serine hydrolase [Xanthomonadaceae bacterium]